MRKWLQLEGTIGRPRTARRRRPPGRGRRVAAVAGVATLTALLAACGSSSKSTSNPTAASGGGSSSSSAGSSATTTGSTAAGSTASGSPILIGITVPDRGALSLGPTMNPGIKGGLYYVNNVLGGIHGHPLKVVTCDSDATPSLEVNCANNFVSKGVVAVYDSYDSGFAAEYPILHRARIPIFGLEAADNTDDHAQDAYFFGPPEEAFAVGPLQIFHQKGLNKLNLSIANVPSAVQYTNTAVLPVAKKLGMNVKITYTDPNNLNWAVIANTLLSSNPQLTGVISSSEQDCDSLITAVRNAGFKGPMLMAGCTEYVGRDPADAVNTYSYGEVWTPPLASAAPAAAQKQIAAYNSAMARSGTPDTTAVGLQAVKGFAGLADFQYALQQGSAPYTAATVAKDLHNVANFQSFMGPIDTCDHTRWPGTSSCNNGLLMLKVAAGDKWQSVYPGGFTTLDPSLL